VGPLGFPIPPRVPRHLPAARLGHWSVPFRVVPSPPPRPPIIRVQISRDPGERSERGPSGLSPSGSFSICRDLGECWGGSLSLASRARPFRVAHGDLSPRLHRHHKHSPAPFGFKFPGTLANGGDRVWCPVRPSGLAVPVRRPPPPPPPGSHPGSNFPGAAPLPLPPPFPVRSGAGTELGLPGIAVPRKSRWLLFFRPRRPCWERPVT
jgi:hypothetical protein